TIGRYGCDPALILGRGGLRLPRGGAHGGGCALLVPRCGSEGGRPLVVSGRPDIAVLPLGVVGAGHGGTAGEVLAVRVPGEGHPLVAVVPLDEQIPGPVPLAFPVGRDLPALVLEEPVKAAKTGDRLARRHAVERPPVAHRVGAV